MAPLPKKLSAIADYPAPTKPKMLLGFLGAINFYRRALPKLRGKSPADVLAPLYRAATEKVPGRSFIDIWKERNLQADFENAKQMLMLATQIAHPDPNLPISLTTDASKTAMAGCLAQFAHGRWNPLGFF